jgi:hypothetical protein
MNTNGQSDTTAASSPPVIVEHDAAKTSTPALTLRDWDVTHAYASYYLEPIDDLDAAAEALVRAGVASSAYVADGMAYWLAKDELKKQRPHLRWREHENHAEVRLPDGIDGWAKHGLFKALLQRFSEKKVLSPLPGPQHEYVRAALEPASLIFGDEQIIICPTLKLYKTGVFVITYDIIGDKDSVTVPELVTNYVNLFARWCDEAWVPYTIARLGATTQLYRGEDNRETREANLGMTLLMRTAADDMAETITVGDLQFKMFPAHAPLDGPIEKLLGIAPLEPSEASASEATESGPVDPSAEAARKTIELGGAPEAAIPMIEANANAAAPDRDSSDDDNDDGDDHGDTDGPTQSYQLSDMFDNAEYAIRAVLDPPPDDKQYLRRGLKPRITRGDYWHNRPQVSINVFDGQPSSASELRERFGDQLGLVMLRVPSAPAKLARTHLGESLRPFDDHSLHISQAVSFCVYASRDGRDRLYEQPHPPVLEQMERACTFEMIDYLAMRCHQLDERASLVRTVAEARAVRADISAVENLARTGFRMGELNDATTAAWERLGLPATVKEAREKVSLSAEAASERASDQGAQLNSALAVVFGLVGAAGLTDSVTKPLWTAIGLPLPAGLEGPVCFAISAALVGIILWFVVRVLRK